jgi:hypothetical protein
MEPVKVDMAEPAHPTFPVYERAVAKNGPKLSKSGEGFVVHPGFPVPPAGSRDEASRRCEINPDT